MDLAHATNSWVRLGPRTPPPLLTLKNQYWRNPNYNWMRMQLAILMAVIFGSSFIDAGEAAS